jgi:hypothetical protein
LLTRESLRFTIHTPLIPRGVIKLALAWDEKAAQLGGFFTSERSNCHPVQSLPRELLFISMATISTMGGSGVHPSSG